MIPKPPLVQTFESLTLPFKLLVDLEVPLQAKIIPILLFIAYLAFPLDFLPDILPVAGLVDDAAVFAACAYLIIYMTPETVLVKYLSPASPELPEKIIEVEVTKKKPKEKNNNF